MDVRLLYFDGWPNWRQTEDRLREALRRVGSDPDTVARTMVTSPEDDDRLSFRGSPTVLLDGEDPFADASAPVEVSCRVYSTPGGLRGAPTLAQLVAVLQRRQRSGWAGAAHNVAEA